MTTITFDENNLSLAQRIADILAQGEVHRPVNWNERNDAVTQEFWNMNTKQFWLEKDVPFEKDVHTWREDMSELERTTLVKALTGLTVLDTRQGTRGMPLIGLHEEDEQVAAVLSFMGMMEHVHAKSYSKIFQSLISTEDINYYMKEWAVNQPNLQYKTEMVVAVYRKLWSPTVTLRDKWRAKAVSVGLESGLFYSGFYFPTLLAGGWGGKNENARMTDTNDIIIKIITDESIHGQYVGWLGYEDFQKFSPEEQADNEKWFTEFMMDLYENEVEYTKELYTELGLVDDVLSFVRHNFNRVFQNLNLDPIFDKQEVNPLILAGIDTGTKTHDYFSRIGSYFKANVTAITDATFDMTRD
jgi:ribonucleoside-diphosphate reductase beta chain